MSCIAGHGKNSNIIYNPVSFLNIFTTLLWDSKMTKIHDLSHFLFFYYDWRVIIVIAHQPPNTCATDRTYELLSKQNRGNVSSVALLWFVTLAFLPSVLKTAHLLFLFKSIYSRCAYVGWARAMTRDDMLSPPWIPSWVWCKTLGRQAINVSRQQQQWV